jgi:hypothetical protein
MIKSNVANASCALGGKAQPQNCEQSSPYTECLRKGDFLRVDVVLDHLSTVQTQSELLDIWLQRGHGVELGESISAEDLYSFLQNAFWLISKIDECVASLRNHAAVGKPS